MSENKSEVLAEMKKDFPGQNVDSVFRITQGVTHTAGLVFHLERWEDGTLTGYDSMHVENALEFLEPALAWLRSLATA